MVLRETWNVLVERLLRRLRLGFCWLLDYGVMDTYLVYMTCIHCTAYNCYDNEIPIFLMFSELLIFLVSLIELSPVFRHKVRALIIAPGPVCPSS